MPLRGRTGKEGGSMAAPDRKGKKERQTKREEIVPGPGHRRRLWTLGSIKLPATPMGG